MTNSAKTDWIVPRSFPAPERHLLLSTDKRSQPTNTSRFLSVNSALSGAPVFALRGGQPVWMGVVKRGAAGNGIEAGLQASPSHLIQAKGKLRTLTHVAGLTYA